MNLFPNVWGGGVPCRTYLAIHDSMHHRKKASQWNWCDALRNLSSCHPVLQIPFMKTVKAVASLGRIMLPDTMLKRVSYILGAQ